MEEIKIGEYVRTKDGYIAKLERDLDGLLGSYVFDKPIQIKGNDKWLVISKKALEKRMVKHSFNIIDLIEVGDYLDGVRVDSVEKDENGHVFYAQNYDLPSFDLKNIKSICTREQFERIEYKLDN